VKKKLY